MTEQKKIALITGITGQDGSYLAELLLSKGYEVHGIMRRSSVFNTERIEHIYEHPADPERKLTLHFGDLTDASNLNHLIKIIQPTEIYNLGAQSHVRVSFDIPEYTANTVAIGTLRLLDAIRENKLKTKFYQAGSSEMFGDVLETPQTESTPFNPASPYGVAKVFAHQICKNYRTAYDMFICNGILFNHESPRRGKTFVTRKITRGIASILAKKSDKIYLGNLDAKRDWGYAPEYCVDLDTQILTDEGFKNYNQIKEGDVVVNFNSKKNKLDRDSILKTHFLDFHGKMLEFSGRGVKIQCTPEHRIIFQSKSKKSKGGWSKWKVCTAKEFWDKIHSKALRTKYDYRLPSFQGYDNRKLDIKDEWLTLFGYLAAEGSVKFTPGNGRGVTISLSQSKYINKKYHAQIKNVCRILKLDLRMREMQDGTTEFIFNSTSSKRILEHYDGYNIHRIPEWIMKASKKQLALVLEAMMNGDGSWSSMTYVSKSLSLISDFQVIATKLGYRTTVHRRKSGIYECTLLAQRKAYAFITKTKQISYKGKVWCVTTKNGSMVIRKDNNVSVIGNCEAMWLMMQKEKPDDYVIATGETHSVKDFLQEAFRLVGVEDFEKYIGIDERYYRPQEVNLLQGDATKAKKLLGWKPKVVFKELVRIMLEHDLKEAGLNPAEFIK